MGQIAWTAIVGGKKVICGTPGESQAGLTALTELHEAGTLRLVVDRCYSPEQIVEAHRYVDAGHKRGSVVIVV